MTTETGVMVVKGDKAWGVTRFDGYISAYGWVNPDVAEISDPKYCKEPSDVTYKGSLYLEMLRGARVVKVKRTITTEFLP